MEGRFSFPRFLIHLVFTLSYWAFGLEGLIEENCMVAGVWVTAESCIMAEVVALSKFAR